MKEHVQRPRGRTSSVWPRRPERLQQIEPEGALRARLRRTLEETAQEGPAPNPMLSHDASIQAESPDSAFWGSAPVLVT